MKNKINIFAAALIALLVFSSGCTKDFESINSDPNRPSLSQTAPNLLLTGAIETMTDRVHNIFLGHEMGSCWVQHMAKVQYTDEDRYVPRVSVINATWTSFYANSGFDIQTIYNYAVATEHDGYKGVALILKSYIISVLTDIFGDIPYTEMFMGSAEEAVLSPIYDSQSSIYTALIANLTEANTLLGATSSSIDGDILFDGDLDLWQKFANSLKLRLLMRISDRVSPASEMTAMLGSPATYPIFESSDEHAALHYLGSVPNNHPINENRKTRDDHRVSKSIIDIMYAEVAAPRFDYRVMAYAEVSDGTGDYVGIPNGLLSATAGAYNGNGLANTSKIGRYFTQGTTPGMLMSYQELQFILAEAAHKDYIPGGDTKAEEYYVEGITSSYYMYTDEIEQGFVDFYGKDPGESSVDDMLSLFLEDGGWVYDPSKAMEQIATQKWVAMFDQGLQAWFEWRRLGFPVLTPAADGVIDQIPVRAFYPSDEFAKNSVNVAAAAAALGGPDDLTTKVWWDVN